MDIPSIMVVSIPSNPPTTPEIIGIARPNVTATAPRPTIKKSKSIPDLVLSDSLSSNSAFVTPARLRSFLFLA